MCWLVCWLGRRILRVTLILLGTSIISIEVILATFYQCFKRLVVTVLFTISDAHAFIVVPILLSATCGCHGGVMRLFFANGRRWRPCIPSPSISTIPRVRRPLATGTRVRRPLATGTIRRLATLSISSSSTLA